MNDTTYNGWSNYATWRVNLEYFDGISMDGFQDFDINQLAEYTQSAVTEDVSIMSHGEARGYALAFLSDVNWHEIAGHLYNQIQEEKAN